MLLLYRFANSTARQATMPPTCAAGQTGPALMSEMLSAATAWLAGCYGHPSGGLFQLLSATVGTHTLEQRVHLFGCGVEAGEPRAGVATASELLDRKRLGLRPPPPSPAVTLAVQLRGQVALSLPLADRCGTPVDPAGQLSYAHRVRGPWAD